MTPSPLKMEKYTVQLKNRLVFLSGSAALLLAAACSPDLNISNPNNPHVARAIASPGDVRNLIAGFVEDMTPLLGDLATASRDFK